MSETTAQLRPNGAWLAHAGEVAQWTVLLLGWLWLGEQGMRLGWSVASGVLAVALWWAARLVGRGSGWAFQSAPSMLGGCGVLTACGVWLPDLLTGSGMAHAGLLALALVWGLWSALIETRTRVSTFHMGPVAWHPLLAAGGVSAVWRMPGSETASPWGLSLLLGLCALVLYMRDRHVAGRANACRGLRTRLLTCLAPSAMGLMMGTLWLGNAWCAGLGWSTGQMVATHLAMMAGLPTLVGLLLRGAWPGFASGECLRSEDLLSKRLLSERLIYASLALLCMGAFMGLGGSALHSVLAMLLPSLAWAVHCVRPRSTPAPAAARGLALVTAQKGDVEGAVGMLPWAARSMALLLGPGLLLGVGATSALHGPLAVQSVLALLGTLAAWQAAALWWRGLPDKGALSTV